VKTALLLAADSGGTFLAMMQRKIGDLEDKLAELERQLAFATNRSSRLVDWGEDRCKDEHPKRWEACISRSFGETCSGCGDTMTEAIDAAMKKAKDAE